MKQFFLNIVTLNSFQGHKKLRSRNKFGMTCCILLLLTCFVLPCYAKKKPSENVITPMKQLEKRQYQTQTYKDDKVIVMKSLLNVFQDEGFMLYNVNSLLGFIYGVKDFDINDPNVDISKEFGFTKSRLNYNGVKIATLEAAANITEYGEDIRVRVNFKRKLLNEYGNAQFIEDLEDASFYEEFFQKVETALELQKKLNTNIEHSEADNSIKPDVNIPTEENESSDNIQKEEAPLNDVIPEDQKNE